MDRPTDERQNAEKQKNALSKTKKGNESYAEK